MSTDRNDNGAMNPTAAPFVPFAFPQPSLATQRTNNSRLNVQDKKHENKEVDLIARHQVMSSVMGKDTLQQPDGSPSVNNSSSSIARARCEVSQGHAATNCVRDQMLRPTASNPSEPVHQNPSPRRLKIDPSEGLSHDYFFRRRRTKRTSRASSKTPRKSKPYTSGEETPTPLEATPSQEHRMSDEKITPTETETDNGMASEKVRFPLMQIRNQ